MSLSQVFWLGSTTITSVIAAYYGVLAVHRCLISRSVLGPIRPETHEILRQLIAISRQGNRLILIRLMLFYGGLSVLVVAVVAREWSGLIVTVASFVLIWWMRVRTTTTPVALILGTSSHSSIRRHRAAKRRLSPLRVVSLLDVEVPWDMSLSNKMILDCFRTTNEDDWWLVAIRLMEISPLLVLDAAAETEGVLREAQHILCTGLWRKCLFLTPPDGSTPVLDRLLTIQGIRRRDLRIVRYEETVQTMVVMVAHIRMY